ncbi:iron complex outermembrane receptor protein [Advenella incenata]|jgi:iron complex outermembrane receptor protein|uniref:Iron complex outermembrane receptor protein n=2 Tax=Advenella incenata TaxID=267800 RepID=A0A4Q7VQU1_9BURK|nr:TonB-dependent receptor [Advenella incenata]RZT98578.1 iron complex outermembrane receptor protein [Advenella incenata]
MSSPTFKPAVVAGCIFSLFTCTVVAQPVTSAQAGVAAAPDMATPATAATTEAPITQLSPIVATSTRMDRAASEIPASVSVIDGAHIRANQMQVNLSEGLRGIPGLTVRNRQNYAQDLQIGIRGFGARSAFGVRGIRLYVDGIPATMPDGQGQTSNIDLSSIESAEVLRGPFSTLHGNSSGGVLLTETETGEGPLTLTPSFATGSDGQQRYGMKASGSRGEGAGAIDYLLSTNHFRTDGYREHSRAEKNQVNAKLGLRVGDAGHLSLLLNHVDVSAQDPQGLTREEFENDPRSSSPNAQTYNVRKTTKQTQGGLVYEQPLSDRTDLRIMGYYGQRETRQFLSIPIGPQRAPSHSGGVIWLKRQYGGADIRLTSHVSLADRPLTLVAGLAWDTMREARKGYENFIGNQLGVQGNLRRDEINNVWNLDPYVQASWNFAERWTLDAGLRYSNVHFKSSDRYITNGNADDSGTANYSKLLPVIALNYQATPDLSLYITAGRGFETPTFNELSYRADNESGLNFGLKPSVNTTLEAGLKANVGYGQLTAAVFRTYTKDEIVSAGASGGRTTYQNAGRTLRDGVELSWDARLYRNLRAQLSYTYLHARYRDSFCSGPCSASNPQVPAGNLIPGIARNTATASLAWEPEQGWNGGVDVDYLGKVYVNDQNSESAPSAVVTGLHTGYTWKRDHWTVNAFARVDNVFNARYAGSVIINDANNRYYEPAPGRNWTAGMTVSYRF